MVTEKEIDALNITNLKKYGKFIGVKGTQRFKKDTKHELLSLVYQHITEHPDSLCPSSVLSDQSAKQLSNSIQTGTIDIPTPVDVPLEVLSEVKSNILETTSPQLCEPSANPLDKGANLTSSLFQESGFRSTPNSTPKLIPNPTPKSTPNLTANTTPKSTANSTASLIPKSTPNSTASLTPKSTPNSTASLTPKSTPNSTPRSIPKSTPSSTPHSIPKSTPNPTTDLYQECSPVLRTTVSNASSEYSLTPSSKHSQKHLSECSSPPENSPTVKSDFSSSSRSSQYTKSRPQSSSSETSHESHKQMSESTFGSSPECDEHTEFSSGDSESDQDYDRAQFPEILEENEPLIDNTVYEFDEPMDMAIGVAAISKSELLLNIEVEIHPQQIIKIIKNDDYIDRVRSTLIDLYEYKVTKYQGIYRDLEKEIQLNGGKIQELTSFVSRVELEQMSSRLNTSKTLQIKVKSFIRSYKEKLISFKKKPSLARLEIRRQLIDTVKNPDYGIISLSGVQEPIQNTLCKIIFLMCKGVEAFLDPFMNISFINLSSDDMRQAIIVISNLYTNCGLMLRSSSLIIKAEEIVGEYIGQTACLTKEILLNGLETSILIEMPRPNSFDLEIVKEVVDFLDKFSGLSIIIMNSPDEIVENYSTVLDQGFQHSFPYEWKLPKYSSVDFANLFIRGVQHRFKKKIFTEDTAVYLYTLIAKINGIRDLNLFSKNADITNLIIVFVKEYHNSLYSIWGEFSADVHILNNTFNKYLEIKGFKLVTSTNAKK